MALDAAWMHNVGLRSDGSAVGWAATPSAVDIAAGSYHARVR